MGSGRVLSLTAAERTDMKIYVASVPLLRRQVVGAIWCEVHSAFVMSVRAARGIKQIGHNMFVTYAPSDGNPLLRAQE